MSGRIRGFDGLRALAVITVVLTHLGLYAPLDQAEHLRHTVLPLVAGRTGVIVFFVLSGFLITLLLLKEYDKNGRISSGTSMCAGSCGSSRCISSSWA